MYEEAPDFRPCPRVVKLPWLLVFGPGIRQELRAADTGGRGKENGNGKGIYSDENIDAHSAGGKLFVDTHVDIHSDMEVYVAG